MRTARVFRPRSTSQASNGPGDRAHRVLVEGDPLGDHSPSRVVAPGATTTAPPMTSLCPPAYFVVQCTTTSAPSAMGGLQVGRGEGVVDDEQGPGLVGDAPRWPRCRRCRAAGWSGVSTHTIRVSGRSAARTESTSATVRDRVVDPPAAAATGRRGGRCRRRRRTGRRRGRRARAGRAARHPHRRGRWRRRSRAHRPRARRCTPRAPCGSGWPTGSTRSRRAGRRCRPACRCSPGGSGGRRRRSWGPAPARHGWRARRSRGARGSWGQRRRG